jgi:hypothetical protein
MRSPLLSLAFVGATMAATTIFAPQLNASAAAQANDAPPAAANVAPTDDPDQRVRCRNIQATGSLVRRDRVCRTVAEWRRIAQSGNDRARDVVGTGTVCAGGQCGNGN